MRRFAAVAMIDRQLRLRGMACVGWRLRRSSPYDMPSASMRRLWAAAQKVRGSEGQPRPPYETLRSARY